MRASPPPAGECSILQAAVAAATAAATAAAATAAAARSALSPTSTSVVMPVAAEAGGDAVAQQQQKELRQELEEEQQQQQQQGFQDVEVYMVCPATIAWAASRCSSKKGRSSSSSRSSSSRRAGAAGASVMRACQWLVRTETVRRVSWRSPLVLQGELLQFGVVLLPQQQTAAAAGDPAAVRAWLEKYASLHGSVDLLLRDGDSSSSSSSSKAAGHSALSCQFWEAQAFPIDSQETVSMKVTHFTYTAAESAAPAATATEASATAAQAAPIAPGGARISAATTRALQPGLSPFEPLAALSWNADTAAAAAAAENDGSSSSSNSSVCSTTTGASSSAAGAAAARASQQQQRQQASMSLPDSSSSSRTATPRGAVSSSLSLRDERVSLAMQLMMQALGSSAIMPEVAAPGSASGSQETLEERRELRVSCNLMVQRPLQVTTALMDSFMYVQIENSTDSIPVVVENVILRSVNSNAQGDLPVTLYPQEQHSVLLRLDEAFLFFGAPQWGAAATDGGKGLSGEGKAVLPLCLKCVTSPVPHPPVRLLLMVLLAAVCCCCYRHVAGSSGPAVWSQFGAECQLPLRPPLQVSINCLSDGCEGGLLTAVLCVANHGAAEVDLLALLPRDIHYHLQPGLPPPPAAAAAAGSSSRHSSSRHSSSRQAWRSGGVHETPALIPLTSKKDLGSGCCFATRAVATCRCFLWCGEVAFAAAAAAEFAFLSLLMVCDVSAAARIAPGCTQSVYLQLLATRSGLHSLPPLLLLDRGSNRKVLARGGQLVHSTIRPQSSSSIKPMHSSGSSSDSGIGSSSGSGILGEAGACGAAACCG
ncbi:hypothetical protein Emed_005158 [Eimeria media]